MRNNKFVGRAPATVANVSCGFDILGFALAHPQDEVVVSLNDSGQVQVVAITGDGGRLPYAVEKNTAGVAVLSLLRARGYTVGVDIELHKHLPLGSGMGSSAASAAAALAALHAALELTVPMVDLLPHALEAERIACGSAHADNVAPALLGGFTLIRSYHPLDVISVPVRVPLQCVLVHPAIELRTEDARKVLRPTVTLQQAVRQSGNAAALMVALMQGDYELMARALEDVIAEPQRALFIPGFYDIQRAALQAGAIGCGISGSGPTLFALASDETSARQVALAMQDGFGRQGFSSDVVISPISLAGAAAARIEPS